MKKFISVLTCVAIVFCFCTTAFASEINEQTFSCSIDLSMAEGRKIDVVEGKLEQYESTEPVVAQMLRLDLSGTQALVSSVIDDTPCSFVISLHPSKFGMYEGNTVIGMCDTDQNFKVASFRIEKEAFSIGLMQENLSLSNKTVLYFAVENTAQQIIYYYQLELQNFDFDSMYNIVNNAFVSSTLSAEELQRKEILYLTLSSVRANADNHKIEETIEFSVSDDHNITYSEPEDYLAETINQLKEASKQGFVKLSSNSRSSFLGVPEEVFKSEETDKWTKVWNGWTAKTGYAVYSMTYAMSVNSRLNYLMTYYISNKGNINAQTFDISFTISQNCWVLYNATDDSVCVFDERARVAADPYVYYRSKAEEGVFTRRYASAYKESTALEKISKVVIGYIPYLGEAVEMVEAVYTTGDNLVTGTVFAYPDNYDLQIAQGQAIQYVRVYAKGLKQINDNLYLHLQGDGVTNFTAGFGYSVYDPVWW